MYNQKSMNKEEFKNLIVLFNNTYPKQPKLTVEQQMMFWLSLQNYEIDAVVGAFLSHTNDKEIGRWKPQVPENLTRYLAETDVNIRNLYKDFFDHKDVKDETAIEVWNKLGGNNLRRLPMHETDKKEQVFVDMYKQMKVGDTYNKLPNNLKTKLIGVLKK